MEISHVHNGAGLPDFGRHPSDRDKPNMSDELKDKSHPCRRSILQSCCLKILKLKKRFLYYSYKTQICYRTLV